jgi:aryl-alcohol dehydrogenase-like predicted oxidoreductase
MYQEKKTVQLLDWGLLDLGVKRDEIIIATKVLARMNHKPNSTGLARYHIFNSLDAILKRLQLEYMYILYVHGVDPATVLEEIVKSLNGIVASGKERYVAICNWTAWMVAKV